MTMAGFVSLVVEFLDILFWVCLGYFAVSTMLNLAAMSMASNENRRRNWQASAEDYDVLRMSRFMLPVSIVAPAYNEEAMVIPATRSLLAQDYPEFEVIVVDDGSEDRTLQRLIDEFDLIEQPAFMPRQLKTLPIRAVYRSLRHPRLTVVSKENGGNKADPLNCGINFATHPYLCCVDGDTMYLPGALLSAMSQVTREPESIVGATSFFGISSEPESSPIDADGFRKPERNLLCFFQNLDLMRSFLAYRLAFSRMECMLCNPGAFAIWRRDIVIELNGFAENFSCEDIEMTFRIHEHALRNKLDLKVIALPYMIARTEGPDNSRALIRQRARWQRVVLETVWHFRFMLMRPRYRNVGMIGVPYYLVFEALAPIMQLISLITIVISAWLDLLSLREYLLLLVGLVFATSLPTIAAVRLQDEIYRDYRIRELAKMLLLSPLEFFLYRPQIMLAGFRGYIDFLKQEKGWHKFDRNVREQPSGDK